MSNLANMGGTDLSWVPQLIGPATNFITDIIGGKKSPPPPPPNPLANLPWLPIGIGVGGLILLIVIINKPRTSPRRAPAYDYEPAPRRRAPAKRRRKLPRRRNPHETRSSLNHRLDQIQRDFDRYELSPDYRKKLKSEKAKIIKRLEGM